MEKDIEDQVLEYLKMWDEMSGTNKVEEWKNLADKEKEKMKDVAETKAKAFVEKQQPTINNFFNSLFKTQ